MMSQKRKGYFYMLTYKEKILKLKTEYTWVGNQLSEVNSVKPGNGICLL